MDLVLIGCDVWLVPHKTAAVLAHTLCTPCNRAPVHSGIPSHILSSGLLVFAGLFGCLHVACLLLTAYTHRGPWFTVSAKDFLEVRSGCQIRGGGGCHFKIRGVGEGVAVSLKTRGVVGKWLSVPDS